MYRGVFSCRRARCSSSLVIWPELWLSLVSSGTAQDKIWSHCPNNHHPLCELVCCYTLNTCHCEQNWIRKHMTGTECIELSSQFHVDVFFKLAGQLIQDSKLRGMSNSRFSHVLESSRLAMHAIEYQENLTRYKSSWFRINNQLTFYIFQILPDFTLAFVATQWHPQRHSLRGNSLALISRWAYNVTSTH